MISTNRYDAQPVTNWAPIAGRWSFEGNVVHFLRPGGDAAWPLGDALADVQMRDGKVTLGLTYSEWPIGNEVPDIGAGVILGYNAQSTANVVVQLGGGGAAYSLYESVPGFGYRGLLRFGSLENLRVDRRYSLDITQRGQRIELTVDNVRVFEHVLAQPLPGNQIGLHTWGRVQVLFDDIRVQQTKPRLFVAMQFSEPFNTLYNRVIEPIASSDPFGFDVVRVDELARPGIIFQDIQREISEAKAIVAEISAPNNNVFYELGYAHALNKPTILLAQRGKELPFDIRSYRVIFYDDTIGGKPALEETLTKHLNSILQES